MSQQYGQGGPVPPYPTGGGFGVNVSVAAPPGLGSGFNGPSAPGAYGGYGNGPPPPAGYNNPSGGFNAPPGGGFGQPLVQGQHQWTTMNSTGPASPQNPNQPAGGDIGFNFTGASLPGYIDSSLNPIIQPPTNPYFSDDGQGDGKDQETRPLLPTCEAATADEATAALERYVKKHCCYGPATGIEIQNIQMRSGFKYKLTSHSEQRETVWEFEPYVNQRVDGPTGQQLPGPWDLQVHPAQKFVKEKKDMQIPGTASLRPCHTCVGNGKTRCTHCTGFGGSNCTMCSGTGKHLSETCNSCTGTGRTRCTSCSGTGMENCKTCRGNRQLFVYLKLIVKWDVLNDDFVSDTSTIPKEKLSKKCKGIQVVNEQGPRVQPITNFPDEAINSTSQTLIQKQLQAVMPNGAIREQKQSVEMIRIAEVGYTWKGKTGTFHMFGVDNNIYFPDYPESCYCCCGKCVIS